MQGAASTQKWSGDALPASVKPATTAEQHGIAQPDASGAGEAQHGTPSVQAARHGRHASVHPTAAETSTECFARMEALAGQHEGHLGRCCLLSMRCIKLRFLSIMVVRQCVLTGCNRSTPMCEALQDVNLVALQALILSAGVVTCPGSESAQTPAPAPAAAGEVLAAGADWERPLEEQSEDPLAAWRGLSGAYGALSESPALQLHHDFLSPSVPEACSESSLYQDAGPGYAVPQPHHRCTSPSVPAAELAPMARAQLAAAWHPQPDWLMLGHLAVSEEETGISDPSLAAAWDAHSPAVPDAPCWRDQPAEGSSATSIHPAWTERPADGSPALVPACWREQHTAGSPAAAGSPWREEWSAAASPDTMAALWASFDGSQILMGSPETTLPGEQPAILLNPKGSRGLVSCIEQLPDQQAVDCLEDAGTCVRPEQIRTAASPLVSGSVLPGQQATDQHQVTDDRLQLLQPTEEELHAVMARFQEHCLWLPHDSTIDAIHLAPKSAGMDALLDTSISVSVEGASMAADGAQEGIQSSDSMCGHQQSCACNDLRADERTVLQGESQPEGIATDADQSSRDRSDIHLASMLPGEACFSQLEASQLHLAGLATCSDEEDFAVLDLGAASESSLECDLGRDGAAADASETVYAAPRYASSGFHLGMAHFLFLFIKSCRAAAS